MVILLSSPFFFFFFFYLLPLPSFIIYSLFPLYFLLPLFCLIHSRIYFSLHFSFIFLSFSFRSYIPLIMFFLILILLSFSHLPHILPPFISLLLLFLLLLLLLLHSSHASSSVPFPPLLYSFPLFPKHQAALFLHLFSLFSLLLPLFHLSIHLQPS